ncbi:MAG TPA: hypothetical protein VII32_18470 [Thermoanaerobaculia bacterium]
MRGSGAIRAGGLALLAGAVAFLAVFAYLAARFNYPDVLDGPAATVLPALLATGQSGRAAWAIYALLPLIWIPAGVGAFQALRHTGEGGLRAAMHFASRLIGMFRNVTDAVAPVAEVNNYLLPAFMIVFGVSLLRHRTSPKIAIPASVTSEIIRPTTND